MIIFVGVAGSGKSVQGKLLAEDLKCSYFSMGEFLRQHFNKDIQAKMLKGELINDDETIEVIDEALNKNKLDFKEFILDGFPRTVPQAQWIIKQITKNRFKLDAVFHLKASADVTIPRLLERHRPDDRISVINKRLREFDDTILPIIKILRDNGVDVYDINAEGTPEFVHAQLMKILKG
jgi:adenylate kinase